MAQQYSAAAFYNAYPNGGTTSTSQPTLSSTFDASSAATVAPLSHPALANANPPAPSMDVASQSIQDLGWIADVSREELIAFFAPSDEQPEMEMAVDATTPTTQNDNGQGQAGASQAPYHALPNPIASHAGPSVPPVYTDNNGSYGGPYATAHEHLSPGTGGRVPPTYPDQAFSFRYPSPGNYVYGLVDQHQHQHQGGANGPSPYPAAVASSTYNAPQYSYGYQRQYPNAGYSQQQGSVVVGPNGSTGFLNQNPYQGAGPSSNKEASSHPRAKIHKRALPPRPLPPLNHPAFAPAPVAFAENRVQYANFLNMVRAATMQTERIRWEIAAQNVALRNMVNGFVAHSSYPRTLTSALIYSSANFQAQTPTPQLPPNSGSPVAPVNAHAGPSRLPASAQTAAGSSSFSDQSQLTWRPPNEDLNASNPKKRKRKENIPYVDDPEIRTCLKTIEPQHMKVSFACFRPSDNPAHARPEMNGTVAGVRKHDAEFHGFPTNYAITQNNRKENKDNRHIYPEVECGWKDPDSNAVCEMRLRQDKMAQHICTVHLRSNWYRCRNADHCKTVCRTLEELAPHMLGCTATSTAVWLKGPAAKKQKTGNEELTD
ncbi:hypothetical protein C8F01DRAFT_1089155 [Mycena amicta]|nr:hypothetical protein C8F01DRAFT_1089155 [Mycena amicta]